MNDLPSAHERHDPLLVAAHAAGDLTGADSDRAAGLVRECRACAALDGDVRAIAAAVHDLPRPRAPRDFTLRDEDARRLRRPSWRRAIEGLRGERFRLAQPLGATFAGLGVAGLVFANVTFGVAGAASTDAVSGVPATVESADDERESTDRFGGSAAAPSAVAQEPFSIQQQTVGEDNSAQPDPTAAAATGAPVDDESALVVLSGSLFIVGVGLFGLRWTADRLGDG